MNNFKALAYSPVLWTDEDGAIWKGLKLIASWSDDIPGAQIMDAMTVCQGKPADKLAAAEVYMRLKGYK